MKPVTLEEKIDMLAEYTIASKELAEAMSQLKEDIQFELQANKSMKSEPTKNGNYAMRVKANRQNVNTGEAYAYLESRPDIEKDIYLNVNAAMYKKLADHELKKTGEVIPGIETYESEYVTIKGKK